MIVSAHYAKQITFVVSIAQSHVGVSVATLNRNYLCKYRKNLQEKHVFVKSVSTNLTQ